MRHKSGPRGTASEKVIKDIRRATRKHYSAEEKIHIVLDGLRGEETIAELCRREGIARGGAVVDVAAVPTGAEAVTAVPTGAETAVITQIAIPTAIGTPIRTAIVIPISQPSY